MDYICPRESADIINIRTMKPGPAIYLTDLQPPICNITPVIATHIIYVQYNHVKDPFVSLLCINVSLV